MASSAITKVVVAFVLAGFSLPTPAQCNLDKQGAKSHAESQHPSPSPNYAAWLKQDVRWIITDEERASFKRLRSDEEREQFIQQFWLRRDPTPETFLNEFKQEHYRWMVYVNEHFRGLNVPAWRTDQDRIYIMFGPPDEVTSEVRAGPRLETWRYGQIKDIGRDIRIEFVDRCQCGEFVLQDWQTRSETPRPQVENDRSNELRIMDVLNQSPVMLFKDLDEIVTHKICINIVPVIVSTNQTRVTDYTVLVPITVKVKDKDVSWLEENGERKRTLNVYGRVTSQNGHIDDIFERRIEQTPDQAGQDFTYAFNEPLRSGSYQIDVAVRDIGEDRKGTWSGTITVP